MVGELKRVQHKGYFFVGGKRAERRQEKGHSTSVHLEDTTPNRPYVYAGVIRKTEYWTARRKPG